MNMNNRADSYIGAHTSKVKHPVNHFLRLCMSCVAERPRRGERKGTVFGGAEDQRGTGYAEPNHETAMCS